MAAHLFILYWGLISFITPPVALAAIAAAAIARANPWQTGIWAMRLGMVNFVLPFLLFVFLMALGEDYNILVMTRIREEAHRLRLREAVSRAVGVTGTTVTSAGLILAATFGVAGITDQVDGFLARRWRVESRFGKIADPLADRLMIDAAVILLFAYDRLPWAGLAVILARDVVLLAGYRVLAPRGIEIDVNVVGKAATWILYLAIGCRIVTHTATQWPLHLFWAGIGLAILAAMFYVARAWGEMRR